MIQKNQLGAQIGMAAAAFLLLLFTQTAFAQFNAQISGTVTDTTGAVVSGATIQLTDDATHVVRTTTTGADGAYSFHELPAGSFTIAASAKGFKSSTFSNVALAAESPRNVDIKLEVGGAGETVTVNATTMALQTSDATISGTIDNEVLQRVPAYGRDPYELLRTAPGITGDSARSGTGQGVFLPNGGGPGQSNSGIFQTENQIQISANGQRVADNNYLLDGVSVNSLGFGGAAVVTPNIEAVNQITIISTSYSAEDGRNTGAQIKTVTKSGTNDLHGTGVFTYDQPGLNAYNKYGGPLGQSPVRVGLQSRDWAASLGGPILKDKLFFFLSYEGYSSKNSTYPSQYIETPQYRQFIANDRAGSIADAIANAPGGIPRVLKILPVTCTNPVNVGHPCQEVAGGLDLGSPYGATGTYVPLSQAQSGSGLDGVPDVDYAQLVIPGKSRGNQYNARGDWYLTPRDQVFGSVFFTKLDNQGASSATGSRPNADIPFKPLNSAVTLAYIHTFSPSFLNELRGNFTRFSDNGVTDAAGIVNYGIPYINIQNMNFDSNNDINFGVSQGSTTPGIFAQNTFEIRDKVTKTWGARTLSFGFEYRLEQNNNNLAGASRPVYAFAGIWNFANDTPIFEGINADPNTGGPALTQRYLNDSYYGLFVQHDWKVNPYLTLNSGLRWEYFGPLYNNGNPANLPRLGPPGLELIDVSLTPGVHHLWNSQNNNFSPKFGFAFTPPSMKGNTVVRGGFAMAYNRLNDALVSNATEDGPNYLNFGICCGTAATDFGTPFAGGQISYRLGTSTSPFSYPINPALATGTLPNGLPKNGVPIEVYGVFPDTKTPYSYLYSLEVQRELPKQIILAVGYQGSTGRRYPRLVNQLFLYANNVGGVQTPFGQGAYFAQTDSNQYYNGFNVHATKRLSHGFTLDGVYTWSHAMDQISNGDSANANGNQTDPAHNRTELGPSDYDTRHRLTILGVWDLPGMKSGNFFARAATNGWQINGIYTYHTGFPFTPVTFQLHGIPTLATAGTIGPVRPLSYSGGAVTGCSNSNFINGIFPGNVTNPGHNPVMSKYFDIIPPPDGAGTPPGIGRNSFRGPCYHSFDMSFAKQQQFEALGHNFTFRFQTNMYNIFNQLTLTPFSNGNANPAALIESSTFGKAQSANAGRVIQFLARIQF